jgi:glycosyltransferase involved in cell wall biosynthesis
VENHTWTEDSMAYKLLHRMEKLQTQRASAFIATTEGMRQYAKDRFGVTVKQLYAKPACVDLDQFKPGPKDPVLLNELGLEGKIVCVYAGKLGGIYLKEEVFDFIKACYLHWNDRFRFLMLTNATKEEIAAEVKRTGLPENIVMAKFVSHSEIAAHLSLGDFGLNPVKPVPTKRYCTSIKDGEYWATGLPVVITRDISDDSGIIEAKGIGYVLKELTTAEYEKAIQRIEELLKEDRTILQQKIRAVAETYRSYSIAENIYRTLYNPLQQ